MVALMLALPITARSQTVTILTENFEGAFPGPWLVGDFDPAEPEAYWADVPSGFGGVSARAGEWMGYCAGIVDGVRVGSPPYQPSQTAIMERTVNLSTVSNATLTFWFNIPSIEQDFDACMVLLNDNFQNPAWFRDTATAGWEQATINLNAYVGSSLTLTFAFLSDDSIEHNGWYLDDILVTGSGGGGGGGDRPNLTPHQPTQPTPWPDRIIVSKTPGTRTDDFGLLPSDTLYLDWAVINNGAAAVNTQFTTELYVDDVLRNTWQSGPSLPRNNYLFIDDYNLGTLSAGTHTLRLRTDSGNSVTESSEADNEYTRTVIIGGSPDIRIAPLSVGFNVTNTAEAPAELAEAEPAENQPLLSTAQKLQMTSEALQRFDKGEERVRVIVNLASPAGKPRRGEWDSRTKVAAWQNAAGARQNEVLSELAADEFRVKHRFENQSGFSGLVTRKGLDKLARHPKVASIQVAREVKPFLAQGIPLMNAAVYRSSYSGAGISVAIVDSGVDYSHPRLGGTTTFPNSKVIGGHDFGDDDTDPHPLANGSAHGTACAGIAAGDLGAVGDYIGGVAPSAKIYALKITSGGGSAFDDDIIAAWNWCITHKNDDPANPLLVISTSFGGDQYFSLCDIAQSAFATAANNAVAAGITLFVASGNEGFCDSLASPACISGVISVGAVYDAANGTSTICVESASCAPNQYNDPFCPFPSMAVDDATAADKITSYSNISPFLDLLAPSHRAHTTDIIGAGGDNSSGDYIPSFGGTSAACPYAAGAAVALQSAARATLGRFLTPAEVRQKLLSTGDLVTDSKTPLTKPRVNLGRAIETLGQSASFTIFNDGNAVLNVSSISLDAPAPWLSWTPSAPFTIGPGNAQVIALSVNASQVPAGETTRRLLIDSNDTDESPYPGGVFVTATNGAIVLRPALRASISANNFVISWPTNAIGFTLQGSSAPSGASWGNVSGTITVVGTNNVLSDPLGGTRFYRLRK